MSSSGILYNHERAGFQDITGAEKVEVSKSMSLQEMTGTLRDISEDDSVEGGHSSGVFSCSVDISDVCMADLTKLSDSTVPGNDAVMSTPLTVKVPTSLMGDLSFTPMFGHSDFLSPQFGASDDYLRRNIKFIHKQLGSLKIQLLSEDKYFQTCADKYEEVIANLENQITALKSDDALDRLACLIEETDVKSRKITQLQSELDLASKRLEEFGTDPHRTRSNMIEEETVASTHLLHLFFDLLQSAKGALTVEDIHDFLNKVDPNQKDTFPTESVKRLKDILDAYGEKISCSSATTAIGEDPKFLQKNEQRCNSFSKTEEKGNEIEEFRVANVTAFAEADNSRDFGSEKRSSGVRLEARNSALEARVEQLTLELENAVKAKSQQQRDFDALLREFDLSKSSTNVENYQRDTEFSAVTVKLSSAARSLAQAQVANDELRLGMTSKEEEIISVQEAKKQLETEHKAMVEEFRIKGSSLILENSKLKEEVNVLHKALTDAQRSAEKSNEKFEELQNLYSSLNYRMQSRDAAFVTLEAEKDKLESAAKEKAAVLGRLCTNFNELLAIFRECQGLGLDSRSSESDIDDGFVKLKRRLLDLSQDYISLNNSIKTLQAEASIAAAKLKEKEKEVISMKRKCETKCANLQRTLETVETENKQLVAEKIEQEGDVKRLLAKIEDLELQAQVSKGCADCDMLRTQLQQLQMSLVDKDSAISTLELHIKTCCDYNRKKALHYKHELHLYKKQKDTHSPYAVDLGLSPRKSISCVPKTDVGTQVGESLQQHLNSGSFMERFKIRDLEDKVIKLEKEKTVLKRLCKIRSERLHDLESSQESRSLSSSRSPK